MDNTSEAEHLIAQLYQTPAEQRSETLERQTVELLREAANLCGVDTNPDGLSREEAIQAILEIVAEDSHAMQGRTDTKEDRTSD